MIHLFFRLASPTANNQLQLAHHQLTQMKQALITSFAALMAFSSAIGRLGETKQEIITRYGQGQVSDIQRLTGAQTDKYFKNGFQIEIVMDQGKSIWEIIQRQDGGGEIPDKDVKNILDGYKESKRTWRYDRQKNSGRAEASQSISPIVGPDTKTTYVLRTLQHAGLSTRPTLAAKAFSANK